MSTDNPTPAAVPNTPPPPPPGGLDLLLSAEELSSYLDVPIKTIYDWRRTGHGPTALRIGRHLRYTVTDVRAWLESQRDLTTLTGISRASRRV
jgi:excisionase family DNA binding protein